jgi:tripartite-type tricarboxylate transporter receptor subunit TctC
VQARVREIALQYFKQPQVEARLRDMGMEPGTDATPEALMSELQKAYQRQQALLKSIDYQPQ